MKSYLYIVYIVCFLTLLQFNADSVIYLSEKIVVNIRSKFDDQTRDYLTLLFTSVLVCLLIGYILSFYFHIYKSDKWDSEQHFLYQEVKIHNNIIQARKIRKTYSIGHI
jgi:hypothetical protein